MGRHSVNKLRKSRIGRYVISAAATAGLLPVSALVLAGSATAAPEKAWDKLASCESGGDWNINTGNGYYGGLQFSRSTWRAFGGSGSPEDAPRAEQIAVAERTLAGQGWNAWPQCSRKMGLTHFQPDVDGAIKDTVKKAGDRTVKEVSKSEAAEQKAKEAARKVADEIPGTPGTPPLAGGKASSSTTVSRGTYTVKKGDTLSKIASRTGQSLKSLAKKNPNIKNLNRIRVGQQVNT